MKVYYEVENKNAPRDGLPAGVVEFDDLNSAIEYAENNGADLICEIGGAWDEFRRCWWCGEWSCDVGKEGLCNHCENYLISRGEI